MRSLQKLKDTLLGFTNTINRFPLSVIFLTVAAILNAVTISTEGESNFYRLLFSFLFGAMFYAVSQSLYERFFKGTRARVLFMGITVAAFLSYYLVLRFTTEEVTTQVLIRTGVILFLLFVAFLWFPSVKNAALSFNDSFTGAFKSFFIALFFSGVLYLGVALILFAIDFLITPIDGASYVHAANIVFFLYGSIHFLHGIPNTKTDDRHLSQEPAETRPSRFLESLISYIVIPVTAVFTVILLLYIILNITGEFWTDNLMEPLLISYSITVIVVYLLSAGLKNKVASVFSKVFPKILLPVVLFQTVSSILKIGSLGLTHGRYYIILFGVFATVSAALFCFIPVRKNGLIAPVLIILSLLSILPPVDAFTSARINQAGRLKNVLIVNGMLKENEIIPKTDISEADKNTIKASFRYLSGMGYMDDISWLKTYHDTGSFEKTFGFAEYNIPDNKSKAYSYYIEQDFTLDISGYDFFTEAYFYGTQKEDTFNVVTFGDNQYSLSQEEDDIVLKDEGENELARFGLSEILTRLSESGQSDGLISVEDATFTVENDKAVLTLVVNNFHANYWEEESYRQIESYLLINIK